MKKLLTTISAALFFCFTVNAQHIPDDNFANGIRDNCKECIDAKNNLLPPAKKLTELRVVMDSIKNVSGISGFTSLRVLDISYNNIIILPPLPAMLTELDVSNNNLSALPSLPATLIELDVSQNNLSALPALLPQGLIKLNCSTNGKISSLPHLPSTLKELYIWETKIDHLPAVLPSALERLDCDSTPINVLPQLPGTLKYLGICRTAITSLPQLPDELNLLEINEKNIKCIPSDNTSLKAYGNNGNPITDLFCNGAKSALLVKTEEKTEQKEEKTEQKITNPLLKVYFFYGDDFVTSSDHETIEDDEAEPGNSFHIKAGSDGKVIAAIYLGKDEKPDPAYRDIKYTYTFEVSYHSRYDGPGIETLRDSYKVDVYPRQRRIWTFIPFGRSNGIYIVRVYKEHVYTPIAEGKINID